MGKKISIFGKGLPVCLHLMFPTVGDTGGESQLHSNHHVSVCLDTLQTEVLIHITQMVQLSLCRCTRSQKYHNIVCTSIGIVIVSHTCMLLHTNMYSVIASFPALPTVQFLTPCGVQKQRREAWSIFYMNDVSVYLGRQRGEKGF